MVTFHSERIVEGKKQRGKEKKGLRGSLEGRQTRGDLQLGARERREIPFANSLSENQVPGEKLGRTISEKETDLEQHLSFNISFHGHVGVGPRKSDSPGELRQESKKLLPQKKRKSTERRGERRRGGIRI